MNDYSTASQQNTVKVYPGLARAAAAADLSRQCRWWHILRGVASRRDGWQWFTIDQVIAEFGQYGLDRRQAYALFAAGSNTFFEVNHSRGVVALVGLVRACEALQCSAGRPVALPIEQIAGRLTAWKAAVYALGFANKARNISRRRLQTETGAAPSTQRRYEAQTGVKASPQFAYAAEGETTTIPDGAPWWYDTIDDENVVVWQIVNRLTLHRDTRTITPAHCRRGMSRRSRFSPNYGDGVHKRRSMFDNEPRRLPAGSSAVRDGAGRQFGYTDTGGTYRSGALFRIVHT